MKFEADTKKPSIIARLFEEVAGNDLLSHGTSHTTIGAVAFHF